MQRLIKTFLWMVLLAAGVQVSRAYSLVGPVAFAEDSWQVPLIGYNPINQNGGPPFIIDSTLTGPKNISEGYRRNAGYLVYACDANFLEFYGSNGIVAVDQAFAILNNAFTNSPNGQISGVDAYSTSLGEFPLTTLRTSFKASALGLLDVKSDILSLMMPQLGLADSVRYTWALHNRYQPQGALCPAGGPGTGMEYNIIMRNFDITASPLHTAPGQVPFGQYSPYVNGVLYSYYIYENCGLQNASPPDVDALEVQVDSLANNPPVSSQTDGFSVGQFYTGLTRDDMAGLRALMTSNNIQTEMPASGSFLEDTNNPTTLITTADLGALVTSAQTNSPATLATLFPGVIANSTSYYTNITTPNVIIYATNYPGAPFGTPPTLITKTNGYTTSTVLRYNTTFANVITNSYSSNSIATILTTTFGAQVGAPIGSPFVTTTKTKTVVLTNTPTGDYYILPAGSCGLDVVHLWQTVTNYTTNLLAFSINSDGSFVTQSQVTSYTNHLLEAIPCNLVAPTPRLYRGIEKIHFVRGNYDSLLSQFFIPVTNTYTMVALTNSQNVTQTFQRIVTAPDFLMTAIDFAPGPSTGPATGTVANRTTDPVFDESNVGSGQAGPGVINSPATFTLDKVGTLFVNTSPNLTSYNNGRDFVWGSFDATTNDPIVYPNGTSLANLYTEVQMQISPTTLPNASNGTMYNVQLTVTGGQSPYSWALLSGSQMPNGLSISQNGVISGIPTGNASGLYNFTLQMTDAGNRTINVVYTLTIN